MHDFDTSYMQVASSLPAGRQAGVAADNYRPTLSVASHLCDQFVDHFAGYICKPVTTAQVFVG